MTREESIALFERCETARKERLDAGAHREEAHEAAKAVWNGWARDLLTRKLELEAKAEWHGKSHIDLMNVVFASIADNNDRDNRSASCLVLSADPYQIRFDDYIFPGEFCIDDSTFEVGISFDYASFEGSVSLERCKFERRVWLRHAIFEEFIFCDSVSFDGQVFFNHATFKDTAHFADTTFEREAKFADSTFDSSAVFTYSKFKMDADFSRISFDDLAGFVGSDFNGDAQFRRTKFNGEAWFSDAHFGGHADFSLTRFSDNTDFKKTYFSKSVNFSAMTGESAFTFAKANFEKVPNFDQGSFREAPRLDDVTVKIEEFDAPLWWTPVRDHSDKLKVHLIRHFGPIFFQLSRERNYGEDLRTYGSLPEANEAERLSDDDQHQILSESATLAQAIETEGESKFRALRRLATQGHDQDRELYFYKGEKRIHWLEGRKGTWKRWHPRWWPQIFYDLVSDYGKSIIRPTICWSSVAIIAAACYLRAATEPCANFFDALRLSMRNAFPAVGAHLRFEAEQAYECLYDYPTNDLPSAVLWIGPVQSFLSIVLLFFLFLALRNHFRIK